MRAVYVHVDRLNLICNVNSGGGNYIVHVVVLYKEPEC